MNCSGLSFVAPRGPEVIFSVDEVRKVDLDCEVPLISESVGYDDSGSLIFSSGRPRGLARTFCCAYDEEVEQKQRPRKQRGC